VRILVRTILRDARVVKLIDQTLLPGQMVYLECTTCDQLCEAIRRMQIRGAPAIGVAAAYALALAAEEGPSGLSAFRSHLHAQADVVRGTRPTAVNLFHAVTGALRVLSDPSLQDMTEIRAALWAYADELAEADVITNQRLSQAGAELLPDGCRVLTHCNAGGLATVEWGTALGVIRAAHEHGKQLHVFVDETRPFLQGARLTAWELDQQGVPFTVITDNMAGYFMRRGEIDACIVGADRIAANGDVANKIGTYSVAVLARAHNIPFYVAAPTSTIDLTLETGDEIPIEQRAEHEVLSFAGVRVAPEGARARHPAFDVTPSHLVTAIITEAGIHMPPYEAALQAAVQAAEEHSATAHVAASS
jgi:methylthioribose-1-phosphate isomerase